MSSDSLYQIPDPQRRRLDGWKEIASHLGKGLSVRTAQRWQEEGLPVRRENGRVFAHTDELDRWKSGRMVTPSLEAGSGHPGTETEGRLTVRPRRLIQVAAGLLVAAGVILAVNWAFRRATETPFPVAQWGRLLVRATSENGSLARIKFDQQPTYTTVSPDGNNVYAAGEFSRSLSIFHRKDGSLVTLPLPRDAGRFVMSRDGNRLYILSPSGGIVVVDTGREGLAPRVIPTPGPVYDGALTPDGKKLFITMNRLGVWRMLTMNGQLKQVTDQICPVHLGLDARGQTLVVSYQCGGPKGRNGHDAVEIFNAETEESLGIASGPPIVGGPLSVSPDGRLAVIDGLDACASPDYDHLGCPSVPSLVFHFLRLADRQFVRTIGMPFATVGVPRFIDHGRVLFVGSSLTVMDTSQYVVTERWEDAPDVFNDGPVMLPALRKVFIPLYKRKEILILDAERPECSAPPESLALFYPGDGAVDDAMGGAHLTAAPSVRFGPGRVGQAFMLDGKSSYLVAPWTPFYNFGLRDSSVAMYVKFATVDGEMGLFEHRYAQDGLVARLSKNKDYRFHFEFVTGPGTALHLFSNTSTIADRWYQVCVTKNNKEVVLYVNGTAEDRKILHAENSVLSGPRAPIYLGATQDHQHLLHGKLDEILFYNRALTGEEMLTRFQMRESGPCKL
jgi:DNA-binding beta-propeller fold protein YncE